MTELQRSCPTCHRSFSEGEAVLRCKGCGVLQHPACWVRLGGCPSERPHAVESEPIAYSRLSPPPPPPAASTTARPPREEPIPLQERRRVEPPSPPRPQPPLVAGPSRDPVIGQRARPQREASSPAAAGPSTAAPRADTGRRKPNPGQLGAQTPGLPRLYNHAGILRFWYLPVAALLAVGVAVAVVWGADQLFGGDEAAPAPVPTPTEEATQATTSPTAAPTPPPETPEVTETPGTPGPVDDPKFSAGETAVVVGSAPQCLNVRSEAGLGHPAIDCIADGTGVTVLAGPVEADGLFWWQIDAPNVIGWAAEDYLEAGTPVPNPEDEG